MLGVVCDVMKEQRAQSAAVIASLDTYLDAPLDLRCWRLCVKQLLPLLAKGYQAFDVMQLPHVLTGEARVL